MEGHSTPSLRLCEQHQKLRLFGDHVIRNHVQLSIQITPGPNGDGKPTFVQNCLVRQVDCDEFLSADLIAAGSSPFAPESEALAASQFFLERVNKLEQQEGASHAKRLGQPESMRLSRVCSLIGLTVLDRRSASQLFASRFADRQGH